jgi:hypothetical protein
MKKIVFDLGLLAFCVAAVVFVLQGYDLFETLGRSFIVFVGVELAGALGLAAANMASHDDRRTHDQHMGMNDAPHEAGSTGTYQQPNAQPKGGAA